MAATKIILLHFCCWLELFRNYSNLANNFKQVLGTCIKIIILWFLFQTFTSITDCFSLFKSPPPSPRHCRVWKNSDPPPPPPHFHVCLIPSMELTEGHADAVIPAPLTTQHHWTRPASSLLGILGSGKLSNAFNVAF